MGSADRRTSSAVDGAAAATAVLTIVNDAGDNIEASETGAAVAVAIPAHILSAFRRRSTITSNLLT